MRTALNYTLGVSLFIASATLGWADKGKGKGKDHDEDERGEAREASLLETQLVRVAALGTGGLGTGFGAPGSDPLRRGEVEVHANRTIEIEIRGAAANATYNVSFCRFVSGNSCVTLVPAALQTNAQGDAEAEFRFPDGTENTLAGVFLLARGGNSQFVSGLQLQPAAVDLGVEVELKGTISSINNTNQTFRLETFPVDITVNASTRFSGVDRFADLRVGQNVEVTGIAAASGVTASRIKLKD